MTEEKTIRVPLHVIDATHRVGFFKRVQDVKEEYRTWPEAYEAVEQELEQYGLPRRYKGYDSFRRCYRLWVNIVLNKGRV